MVNQLGWISSPFKGQCRLIKCVSVHFKHHNSEPGHLIVDEGSGAGMLGSCVQVHPRLKIAYKKILTAPLSD